MSKAHSIGVIGLGYVGLPIALAFGARYPVIGFDVNKSKVNELTNGLDRNNEIPISEFLDKNIAFTSDINQLSKCNTYIIAVPTPVDQHKVPDLSLLERATTTVAQVISHDDLVIFESTVYPGCTEEVCIPILETISKLRYQQDFQVGYSPERISPGDNSKKLTEIIKVVSANDPQTTEVIAELYSSIIKAGVHRAHSIKVAEAAKLVENTQRDVNIALMNELAILFHELGINTQEVLQAAGTKWNFLKFHPGLVGGHCIDVDPYYLTYKANQVGRATDVILSGRRVNNAVTMFITKRIIQALLDKGKKLSDCNILIKGLTFKENVSDTRNSRVFDLIRELSSYKMTVDVIDPRVNKKDIDPTIPLIEAVSKAYNVIILAVPHREFLESEKEAWQKQLKEEAIIFDIRSAMPWLGKLEDVEYMSL